MEVTQPLLASIPMTDERVRQWLTLGRLPMADHALVAVAAQQLANETVPRSERPLTLPQLARQLGVNPNAELSFDAGKEATMADANQTAPRAEGDTRGAIGPLAKRPGLLQDDKLEWDLALENLANDPFDHDNLNRLMLAYKELFIESIKSDQYQQALAMATSELALDRYLYLANPRKESAGRNLLGRCTS